MSDAKVQEMLKKAMQAKQQQKNGNTDNGINNGGNNNGFHIYFKGKQTDMHESRIKFNENDTIEKLRSYWLDNFGGERSELDLVYCDKHLKEENYKLKDYGINKPNCIIFATFRTRGGAYQNNNNDRLRIPDFENFKQIKPTLAKDCIMGYDDDDELRVQMPCGHVYSSRTMFNLITMIANNIQLTKLECPVLNCNQTWSFDIMAAAADLNSEEFMKYGNIIASRQVNSNDLIKNCPHCLALVKRPENLTMLRVKCTQCKGSDFCWSCAKQWQGGGFTVCGNNNCGTQYVNEQLKKCGKCLPSGLKKEVPNMRACPRCLTLVTYKEACKHMPCWGCHKKFCFVCLGLQKDDGSWPCNSYTYECNIHPIQVLK